MYSLSSPRRLVTLAGVLFLLAAIALYLYRASTQLLYFEFGDESEKLVAAQLIAQGQLLYKDFFAHHGPLPYAIAQLYTRLVSVDDFTHIRWFNVGLMLITSASIYFSPAFRRRAERAWATGLFLTMMSSVWILIATHMLLYQAICGMLLAIMAMQLFLPALEGRPPTRAGLFLSGLAGTLCCFASYAYGPSVVLLTLASLLCCWADRGRHPPRYPGRFILYLGLGAAAACTAMLLWVSVYGDIQGYWIYHFLFNQQVYARHVLVDAGTVLSLFALSLAPGRLLHTVAVAALLCWVAMMISRRNHPSQRRDVRFAALALCVLAIVMLNLRGMTDSQDNPFVILNFALFAAAAGLWLARAADRGLAAGLAGCALAGAAVVLTEAASDSATTSLYAVQKAEAPLYSRMAKPADRDPYRLIRDLAPRDGDLLSLIFNPALYILADRLPASGHYYYLPWQAAYGRNPKPGYHIDLCADIETRRPPVIWFDDWKVWDLFPISEYEPCVPERLARDYIKLDQNWPIYLLKDRLAGDTAYLPLQPGERRASPRLAPGHTLALPLRQAGSGGARLQRLDVLFGTHEMKNIGTAELRLHDADGRAYARSFDLSGLADNEYHPFTLDPGHYTSGEIVGIEGGGVSVWEGMPGPDAESDGFRVCLRYIYENGSIAFTPGCPAFNL